MSDLSLAINIMAIDSASSVLRGIAGIAQDIAKGNVAGAAMAAGAAIVGIGAASVKMASDFQSGMTSLVTGAGESQDNLKMISDGILDLSVKTGTSTKQLTDAMYMIDSSGIHGSQSLRVLQAAAEGARVGSADLGTTASAVTTILTDYHLSGDQATAATNALITTVASGKTHLQDLAGSMGSVLPLASSLGISFPQVAGGIAVMTNAGMDAQRASMDLANAIRSLAAPNGAAQKSMQAVGLSAQQLKDTLSTQGLTGAIQLIEDHVGKTFPAGSVESVEAFKKIMGGATGYNVALMLGGKNMDAYKSNVDAISKSMNAGGTAVQGWSNVQQDFNFKLSQAQQAVGVFMIQLGAALLPVLGMLLSAVPPVTSAILGMATGIGNVVRFFQQNQLAALALLPVLGALGGYFTYLAVQGIRSLIASIPGMIEGFLSMAGAAWTAAAGVWAAAGPFILVGLAIGVLIAIIILLVTHWSQVISFLSGAWSSFSSWFMGALRAVGDFFVSVWHGIVAGLQAAWNAIVNAVRIGIMVLVVILFGPIIAIGALFVWLYQHNTYFQRMIDAIVGFVRTGIAWLMSAWQTAVAWTAEAWQWLLGVGTALWSMLSGAIMAAVNFVVGWLSSTWQGAVAGIGAAWSMLSGIASAAWNAVIGVFRGAWGAISGALASWWTGISSWFNGLPRQMMQFAINAVQSFINGLLSQIANVGAAASQITQKVASFLGFHSPAEEGAGRELDAWPRNMMASYAAGIQAGLPQIQTALNVVAAPLAILGNPGNGISPSAPRSSSSNSAVTINLTINAPARTRNEAQEIAKAVMDELSRQLRASGNLVTWTSGGRAV